MNEYEKSLKVLNQGRIKAAGVSMDFIFAPYEEFKANPCVDAALQALNVYKTLRENPPSELRNAFFPKPRSEIKAITRRGPGVYRPVLKTDQGPGQFAAFEVGDVSRLEPIQKLGNEGYAATEVHFQTQLDTLNGKAPLELFREMSAVREFYRQGEFYEASLALERLLLVCDSFGLDPRREATVGRDAFFFIRPMLTGSKNILPRSVQKEVLKLSIDVASQFVDLAKESGAYFTSVLGLTGTSVENVNLPFYFQLDAQVLSDATIVLDQVQMPDVGLFITELEPYNNATLKGIQDIVRPLRGRIVDHIALSLQNQAGFNGEAMLVTRKAVLERKEDTLEILELKVLAKELAQRGIQTVPRSAEDAATEEVEGIGLLLNVDTNSDEFLSLVRRRLQRPDKLRLFPDPLLKAAEKKLTGLRRLDLSKRDLENFHALVGEVDQQADRAYRQLLAVDAFLKSLEIDESVLHFYIPGQPTPAAAFRGDVGSLHQISNMLREVEGGVTIRQVRTSPDRAVLFDQNGAIYNVFRFSILGGQE